LDFIRPQGEAIWIYAASSPVIAGCRIEGVAVSAEFASYAAVSNPLATAISLGANPVPNAAQGVQLTTISGTVSILNNDIDVGGTAADQTLGIALFGVGTSPDHEVDIYIFGNNLRNITERVINLNTIGGRAHIERNVITAGATAGPSSGLPPDAITITDASSVLVAHNSIVAEWATGTGILVQGNKSESDAVVVDNDITMPAPEGTTFGANSAGIMITGFAHGNMVLNNRISGHARGALVLGAKGAGIPGSNTFVANDLGGFESSLADVYIDAGVSNTVVVGAQSKIEDHGAGTVVVPMH
jgi:hypothetical protein